MSLTESEDVRPGRATRRRTSAAQGSESAPEPTASLAGSGESAEKPKPARKPRTTKAKKAVEAEAPAKTDASAASEAGEQEKPKRATRTRKTAAKKAESSASAAQEAPSEASKDQESEPAEKPKRATRARRTKAALAEERAASESAAPAAEPAAAPKGEPAPSASTPESREPEASSRADAAQSEGAKGEAAKDAPAEGEADSSKGEGPYKQRRQRNEKGQKQFEKKNAHGKQGHQQRDRYDRRNRNKQHNRREPAVPQTSREDLEKLKVVELRTKAEELGVDHKGMLKAALIDAVFEASMKAEGFVEVTGILDVLPDGYGFVRTKGYLPSEGDVYVGTATIRRNGLRKGDVLAGQTRPKRPNEKFAALQRIDTVNGIALEEVGKRVRFADLTPVFPDERLVLEHGKHSITARVIDLCAPIGKGQRGLIVSPPKAGKTTILKDIAASITANNPEVHLMCLLVDERPEEVTDMERSIKGEVISSTFDMPCENHVAVSEMVIERAKRLVEQGKDVVILLDSLTRLARAYNLATPASGRILSGGVDSTALYPPKKFLGAARNIEGGGSLTILASALIETGSKMDEVIFEEFKGTGNMEVKLDRTLANHRIFPAIDAVNSGTRREDLLLDPQEAPLVWAVRRVLANRNNTERAMDMLIKSLRQTNNNQEFLIRAAKKAQGQHMDENIEL